MPGHATPTRPLCVIFVLVLSLLVLPMAALAQGTVPVTVEVRFPSRAQPSVGVGLPSTSAAASTSTVVLTDIALPSVETRSEKEAKQKEAEVRLQARPLTVGGFLRYERVDFDTPDALDLSGNIYSTNFQMAWDIDQFSVGFLIPYDFLDLKSFDAHRIGAIGYGQYHLPLSALATLNFTVDGNYTYTAINRSDLSDVNTFGGGATLSLTLDKEQFVGSGALSYQFYADDSGIADNQQHLLKVGATAGMRLGSNAAITVFGVWTYDMTDYSEALRGVDRDYFDLGLELAWNLSPRWRVSGGYKAVLGLEDFASHMVFLGTLLRF